MNMLILQIEWAIEKHEGLVPEIGRIPNLAMERRFK